ncbi:MAG TPA: tetratricopeptide repeat protein [Terriglobales bacterium]|nr:tetratricopeptide repeat protein [Terriglobales bacterium]
MARFTRHELKEDKFAQAAKDTVSWATEHEKSLLTTFAIVLVIVGVLAGGWFWYQDRESKAGLALGEALRIYNAPIVANAGAVPPEIKTFPSSKERALAAHQKFQEVAQKYSWTGPAQTAEYFAGLTAMDAGDSAGAESALKQVAGARNQEIASLAKFALASLYRSSNRPKDAIQLYKELIERPTSAVPKNMAQLELAGVYAPQQPLEAKRLYEQIQKDDPKSPAASIASQRLADLTKQ